MCFRNQREAAVSSSTVWTVKKDRQAGTRPDSREEAVLSATPVPAECQSPSSCLKASEGRRAHFHVTLPSLGAARGHHS